MTTIDRPRADSRLSSRLPQLAVLGDGSPAPSRPRFAWVSTGVNVWILTGLFVDGWFHIHDPGLETFFTPWHALLYSGVAAAVVAILLEVRRQGRVPDGYLPSVLGGLVVGFAGFVDAVWHETLGVEADLAALLSPPHLMLILAGTLVFAGPLRAALRTRSRALDLPAAFSAAAVLTGLMFFTQYASPYTQLLATSRASYEEAGAPVSDPVVADLRQVAGIAGLVLVGVLVGGAVALLRSRTTLPTGALFVAVAVPPLAMTTLHGHFFLVPGILLAGAAVEAARRLPAAPLAALAGGGLALAWVLSLLAAEDVVWNVELLSGAVCSAAAAGFLVGWLVKEGRQAPAHDQVPAAA